jgi:murein DD-endopeptidase MepM/ murein hydrolase activator NlpD
VAYAATDPVTNLRLMLMTFIKYPNYIRRRLVLLGLGVCTALALTIAVVASAQAQTGAWQTYMSDDAAYSFDYPPNTLVTAGDDASLRFRIVYAQFALADTTGYQGVSVMVMENPGNLGLQQFIAATYQAKGAQPSLRPQQAIALQVGDRQALKLQRDPYVGDLDKYTVLAPGDGVVYRINLYGGGDGGPIEPPPVVEAAYDRLVQSFRVRQQPLKPKPAVASPLSVAVDPPIATVFSYLLQNAGGVNFGIPVRVVNDGTHMEWLGYAIRNLDQWGIKCYGVDWERMIHTGEDWYRLDGANTAGQPVYAVSDGVVALQNPGISYPGNVVMIRHRLPDGRDLYSMYGHVTNVSVVQGQIVQRGQQIATVLPQNYTGRTPAQHASWDSHVHFEMRWFLDGANIYVPGANAYNYNYPSCTYAYPGRGYTYIIHPDNYPYPGAGYTNPSAFIGAHLAPALRMAPSTNLIQNGGFESGPPGLPWVATNSQNINDPLIYQNNPHTGLWGGWLGNVLSYTDTLAQSIAIPPGTITLQVGFWRFVRSTEPAGSANDQMTVQLTSAQGQAIGAPFVVTSAAVREAWVQETVSFTVGPYMGTNVTLSFTGHNDAANVSSFFIDDISATPVAAWNAMIPIVMSLSSGPQIRCSNIVGNGDFEAASPGRPWTGVANAPGAVYNDPFINTTRAHSGAQSGRVGSPAVNSYWNELLQTVQLPGNVVSVTLTYWRFLDTSETSVTTIYDRFTAGLETEQGIQIVPPQHIDNTSSGHGAWVQESIVLPNASDYSGQRLWVSFKGTTDSNLPSSLYVDDVQLQVCALQ